MSMDYGRCESLFLGDNPFGASKTSIHQWFPVYLHIKSASTTSLNVPLLYQ